MIEELREQGRAAARRAAAGRAGQPGVEVVRQEILQRVPRAQADLRQARPRRPDQGAAREDRRRLRPRRRCEPKYTPEQVAAAFDALEERVVRDLILEGKRIDGRNTARTCDNQLRGRRPAADPRLGHLPARRDPGPGHHHPGHRQRRAARRRPRRRIQQEVHARLQLPAVLASASASRSAGRAGARSATAPWPNAASRRSSPARKVPLHHPRRLATSWSPTARAAWHRSAAAPCR